jgi:hypothetical protein
VDDIFPVTAADVEGSRLMSFDGGFDSLPGLTRLGA